MSDLEGIVRPFSAPDFRPANAQSKVPPKEALPYVELKFGSAGANVFTISASFEASKIKSEDQVELSRTFDVVKVKNTEDPDQFIETEVMTAFQLRSKPRQSSLPGGETGYRMQGQPEADNIEIIKKNQKRRNNV